MKRRLLIMTAESPVHAGGAAAEGSLDLPIQREKSTGLPVIWGQSLKGALREASRDQPWEIDVFGDRPPRAAVDDTTSEDTGTGEEGGGRTTNPADQGKDTHPGQVAIGDAQLLAFPAATLQSGFAWVTSRALLSRLQRKALLLGPDLGTLLTPLTGASGVLGDPAWAGRHIVGPYVGQVSGHTGISGIGGFLGRIAYPTEDVFTYTRTKLAEDLLVFPDAEFTELTRLGSELLTRIQLEIATKTVAHGPFQAEHLPSESILAAVLSSRDETLLDHLQERFDGKTLQLGGDESIGKGLLWCRVHTPDSFTEAMTTPTATESEPAGV